MASFCMFDVGESVVPSAVRRAHLATVGPEWTDSAAFFFCFVLRGCVSDSHLLAAVSSFILLPVSAASHDRRSRLEAEAFLDGRSRDIEPSAWCVQYRSGDGRKRPCWVWATDFWNSQASVPHTLT